MAEKSPVTIDSVPASSLTQNRLFFGSDVSDDPVSESEDSQAEEEEEALYGHPAKKFKAKHLEKEPAYVVIRGSVFNLKLLRKALIIDIRSNHVIATYVSKSKGREPKEVTLYPGSTYESARDFLREIQSHLE